ncbi:hypothetical protein CIHG_09105 [Coccidioides immitis H538.4]|uniref:Uncharacterized protein n=2 Tax=Coccidioides immitis TaxID=5501 RepID=A0A0J8S1V0_COCIT|nr:hypothetical protein CIRG_06541 [Coccidioides immitis RMSCC 2394]KMU91360.1 hypothetical protein CIHG_09105 [Coccidioides immitis H538.4]
MEKLCSILSSATRGVSIHRVDSCLTATSQQQIHLRSIAILRCQLKNRTSFEPRISKAQRERKFQKWEKAMLVSQSWAEPSDNGVEWPKVELNCLIDTGGQVSGDVFEPVIRNQKSKRPKLPSKAITRRERIWSQAGELALNGRPAMPLIWRVPRPAQLISYWAPFRNTRGADAFSIAIGMKVEESLGRFSSPRRGQSRPARAEAFTV